MTFKIYLPLFFLLMSLGFSISTQAQTGMAVNTTGSAANSSAMLDVASTSQGLLTPRMTAAQRTAISSPATGLLVYQTDAPAGFYYYGGGSWTQLLTASKYVVPMGSGDHVLRLTTTSTGAADSVNILGLGAAGNQLVNINGGSYLEI